jgi:hypothetical protein
MKQKIFDFCDVGQIAPALAGNAQLPGRCRHLFQYHHIGAAFRRPGGSHESGGSATDDDNFQQTHKNRSIIGLLDRT